MIKDLRVPPQNLIDTAQTPALLPKSGLSFVSGAITEPLLTKTVSEYLSSCVDRFGERPAAVFCESGVRWSWRELADKIDQAAKGMLALGIEKGDRVGIWAPNCPEWIVTQFAAAKVGAILVNLNPANKREEMEYAINQVGMKALFCAKGVGESDFVKTLNDLMPEIEDGIAGELKCDRTPTLTTIVCFSPEQQSGMFRFKDLLEQGAHISDEQLHHRASQLSFGDPINIQFTSGTTGKPKAATLTHHNIVNNAKFVAAGMKLTEEDKLCIPVPLFHCFGMVMSVLTCVQSGACMVFPSESFNEEKVMAAVSQERCTALHGVPRMFVKQLNHPKFSQYDFSSLRTGIMAGATCLPEFMKRVVNKMHMDQVVIAYGMTETSPVSFQGSCDDPLERRVSTVGRVMPHLEVKIVNPQGDIVPIGEPGEIWTRGYSVMSGYWGDPEKTEQVIDDGWMRTGDVGTIDSEGYCNIVGRIKDMISVHGEKYSPHEIEGYLLEHPKVVDVQVIGVPSGSEEGGEVICACIIPKEGQQITRVEIKEFFKDRIDPHKVPRIIELLDQFPETLSGKPKKSELRRMMCEKLGLTEGRTA